MAEPLFSLITITFNAERTLGRTLESVRAQTCRDFEYLVVDGGSTDGTLALARGAEGVSRVVSGKDRGISDAFNKGVALARGELVGFVNADDWYEPTALEVVAREHRAQGADVYCGRQRYWDGERVGATFEAEPAHLRSFMSVNHIASFARRHLFIEHGGFKLGYRAAMDYELYLRFLARGARFARVEAVLANMSLGGVSDRKWRLATAEVRQAQLENGVGYLTAQRHYLFQLAKGATRRFLEGHGGQAAVDLFRERLARVRKHRAET